MRLSTLTTKKQRRSCDRYRRCYIVVELHGPRPSWKWAGGKRQLLPELHKHVPEKFGRYFEPFFGGGALFWSLQPKTSTIGDLNVELTTALKEIKNNVGDLIVVAS